MSTTIPKPVAGSDSFYQSPVASPTSDDATLESLLAAGDLRSAAILLRDRGELSRARDLFARIGAWTEAAAIAHSQGDRLSELSSLLRLGDPPRIQALLGELHSAPTALRVQAATVCEAAGALREAAALHISVGDAQAADRLLVRAGDLLGIAKLAEAQGGSRRAIESYRRFLQSRTRGTASAVLREDLLTAHRGCARLLCRIGEVEASLPHLQAARRLLLPPRREDADELQSVEAELIDAFLLLDEPELALRLFGQHAAWCPAARQAQSPVAYARQRAQSEHSDAASATDALFLRRYRIGPLLGSGSVGRVHIADDLFSGRRVALKLLALAGAGSVAGGQLYARFCREATLLSRLHHPRLLRIEAFHATAGALALEYMAGGSANQAARPLGLASARRLLLDTLEALSVLHAAGVLHRDVKPHNIFLDELGGAKLGDLGIATLKDLGVTQTEGLVGTLGYMAPEQIRSSTLSVATDVYGLAVSAFELLTGTLPFAGPDFIAQHLDAPTPDPRRHRPGLPAEWADLLQRLLHKDPRQRLLSIDRLRAEVAALPTLEDPSTAHQVATVLQPQRPAHEATGSTTAVAGVHSDVTAVDRSAAAALRTAHSEIWVTTEARLGRTVVVERFAPGVLQSPGGAAHLAWLRRMAALGGPGLQRVLHIRLSDLDGLHAASPDPQTAAPRDLASTSLSAEVYYEHVGGVELRDLQLASAEERQGLRRLLSRLHGAGIVHGAVARSLVREPTQLCLLLHGRGPLSQLPLATTVDDLGNAPALHAHADPESDLSLLR